MGYSNSPETLAKIRPMLKEIEAGNPCVWRTPPGGSRLLAYKIREALRIARMFSSKYPELARASYLFKIREPDSSTVRAVSNTANELLALSKLELPDPNMQRYVEPEGVAEVTVDPTQLSLPDDPTEDKGLELTPDFPGPQSQFTIISHWTAIKPAPRALRFPEATLTTPQLKQLYRWAKDQKPEIMLLVDDSGVGVTVAVLDPEMAEFQWTPDSA